MIHPTVLGHYYEYVLASDRRPLSGIEQHAVKHVVHNLHLMDPESDIYLVCKCCGVPETATYCEPDKEQMVSRSLCFICNLWQEREPKLNSQVLWQGTMFSPSGIELGSQKFLGHGGRAFKITKTDGTVIFSNNVWCGGDLPWYLREKYPDNCVMEEPTRSEWEEATKKTPSNVD